ncbi:MAG TPA: phospholipase, partial [Pilimelia sp.]|nr:phospholipase [Pilimelia sp.]
MLRRLLTLAAALTLALGVAVAPAVPAAAVTAADKAAVLARWTQTSADSYAAWDAARVNRAPWAAYRFDWTTDYCSSSPDNPLGFDFRYACWRHDFGYRNYRAAKQFAANKARLDDAFYADLRRRCGLYAALVRPACYSLAWTYYQAVRVFGAVVVSSADVAEAAELLPAEAA